MEYNSIQNNFSNYNQIDQYIKALRNLENDLQKKEYELSTITNLYQNLKKLNVNLNHEIQNLNEKNNLLISEKDKLQSKYEIEIENINSNFKKKETDYQTKISNLSTFNIDNLKNKIENDLMLKYEEKIFAKDQEILDQKKINDELQQKYELTIEQIQFEKDGLLKDINTLKNLHNSETNDLLQRIQILKNNNLYNNNNFNTEQFLKTKNELQNLKHQFNVINNENIRLKKENEILIKDKNKLKNDYMILEKRSNFNDKNNENEIQKLNNNIDILKIENNNLKNDNKEKNNKIEALSNEKINLRNNLSNKEIECQQLLNEINVLNGLLKVHQEEIENNLIKNNKDRKENILKERIKEEGYQKEIEELKLKLKKIKNLNNFEEIINDKDDEIKELKNHIKEIESNSHNDRNLKNNIKIF